MTDAPADLLEIERAGYSVAKAGNQWELSRWTWGRKMFVGNFDTREQALAAARERIDQAE